MIEIGVILFRKMVFKAGFYLSIKVLRSSVRGQFFKVSVSNGDKKRGINKERRGGGRERERQGQRDRERERERNN